MDHLSRHGCYYGFCLRLVPIALMIMGPSICLEIVALVILMLFIWKSYRFIGNGSQIRDWLYVRSCSCLVKVDQGMVGKPTRLAAI